MEEIGVDDQVLEAYKVHWQHIRTHYQNRGPGRRNKRKVYVIRQSNPTVSNIASTLRLIHQEQQVAYKFNLQLSFLMHNVDTNEARLFYHGENTRFFHSPPLIDNQQDMEQQISLIDAADILESAALQRPNTKWRMVKIVGFTVTVHAIRGRPLGAKNIDLPSFIKRLKCVATLTTTPTVSHTTTTCVFFGQCVWRT